MACKILSTDDIGSLALFFPYGVCGESINVKIVDYSEVTEEVQIIPTDQGLIDAASMNYVFDVGGIWVSRTQIRLKKK